MTPYDQEADNRLAALLEEDAVHAWRRSQFIGAGCKSDLAELLASLPVDTHHFAQLIAQGCSPETAAAILS